MNACVDHRERANHLRRLPSFPRFGGCHLFRRLATDDALGLLLLQADVVATDLLEIETELLGDLLARGADFFD
jgi:hypothetical protein